MVWMLSSHGKVTPEAIKEFNGQSPRTTAIVGAAIVEDCLARLIADRLPVDGDTKKGLFKDGAPLGNLDAKTKVAYVLGIVSKAAFQNLTKIVEIRNKFAHRLEIADFNHPDVKPLCEELKLIEKHIFPSGTPDSSTPQGIGVKIYIEKLDEYVATPRGRYFLSIMLFHSLDAYVRHPENPKPVPPRALM